MPRNRRRISVRRILDDPKAWRIDQRSIIGLELTNVGDEDHTLMLGQFDGDVVEPQDAAFAVVPWPDGTDFAGAAYPMST